MVQKELKGLIVSALSQWRVDMEVEEVHLEHPAVEEHGDYASNIALAIFGNIKNQKSNIKNKNKEILLGLKTPRELAEQLVKLLREDERVDKLIEKVEVAGPGFINFYLKKEYLLGELDKIIERKESYGMSMKGKGKRVIVEYSSPNIAKPFGIGHLSSTIIGQSLYNLHQYMGYEVIGDNHLGDWGTQFGKLLFMIKLKGETDLSIENLEKLYVEFHQHSEWEEEGRKWFKRLEEKDEEARELWEKCIEVSMKEFERIYALLWVKIDHAYGESFYEEIMREVIAEAKDKKIAYLSEGAWIIDVPGIESPLMLVKSDGGTTYATRDLATVKFRKEKWDPDIVIYEVGVEQSLHFEQVFGAARKLGYVRSDTELVHTKHGLYLDKDGKKFSTRKGKTIKLEEVLTEAVDRAKKIGDGLNEDVHKIVGIGAIKYFNLSHNIQSNVVFAWEQIMALDGNSGPYLQYTFARTRSVLMKAGAGSGSFRANGVSREISGEVTKSGDPSTSLGMTLQAEELSVLRWIYRFPEIVEEAAKQYAPNLLCTFLYELAQRYNTFYNKHSILQADTEAQKQLRLEMTAAVGQVLKNGLGLLGIEAPEKM